MREIKFRAWRDGEMIYQDNGSSAEVATLFNRIHGQHIVMQATGLKDKSGKDIFEHDIVKCWVSRYPDSMTAGVVCWNNHVAAFQIQYEGIFNNFPTDFMHKWHTFEIIGNTFENPELLK
jgi:uncharacterized phage protein (TIGR01671 family)